MSADIKLGSTSSPATPKTGVYPEHKSKGYFLCARFLLSGAELTKVFGFRLELVFIVKNPESISPKLLESNLKKALSLGVKEILLWGFEYWYYQKSHGDNRYLEVIKEYL